MASDHIMSEYRIYRNGQLLMELDNWHDRPKSEYMDYICWERPNASGSKFWYRCTGETTVGIGLQHVPKELKLMELIRS